MKLFDWQQPIHDELITAFRRRSSCLLVAPPGAGKTYISAQLLANRLPLRALILAPKSALPTWTRVLNDFGVTVGEYAHVMNYEQLTNPRSSLAKEGTLGKWRRKVFEWDLPPDMMLIIDESHRCGGIGGKTKTCGLLIGARKMGVPHLFMTATMPDNPLKMKGFGASLDLFPVSDFWNWCLGHGVRKARFHNGFEFPQKDAPYYLSQINDAIFHVNPARGVLVKMEDVLKFYPEGHVYQELVEIPEAKEKQIRRLYADDFEKLDQLIEDAEYQLVEDLHIHQATEMMKVPVFKEEAQDLLDQGYSVVIFVNYRATALKLCEELKTESLIIGEQSAATRAKVIDDFQANDTNVVIVTASAGGEAISLHDLDGGHPRVSLLSPIWDPVKLRQVLGRIWRTGGRSLVTQRILTIPGIEERIYKKVMMRTTNMGIVSGDDFQIVEGEK
jgi:hypothetical protein